VHALDLDHRPLAAIVFYRSHRLSEDYAPITALTDALHQRGLAVGVIFAGSLKAPETANFVESTLRAWCPAVVLNATGFSARQTSTFPLPLAGEDQSKCPNERSPLDAANAPILQLILAGTTRDQWSASTRGLTPADLAMQVALPELDGRLLTTAISFKQEADGRTLHRPNPDGIALAADRAAGWARLRRTPAHERQIAIVLSDYPGLGGQRGHAVGLDTFASLAAILDLLRTHAYQVQPLSAADLTHTLCHAAPRPVLSLSAYGELFQTLPQSLQDAVLLAWGDPADDPAIRDGHFTLRHVTLGNVAAFLQPERGDRGDRRASYHDADLPPRHAFIAFYLAQRHRHALVHLGTHGALEWLPGKAAALSATCWPRALIGGLPVIYPFIVNNPGEAAAAKRRLGAVTIGHLTPPIRTAGLYGDAAALEQMIDEYAAADGMDRRRTALLRGRILERAASAGLLEESGVAPGAPEDDALARLDAHLCDVKDLQIRDGLHVFGTPPRTHDQPGAAACAPAERAAILGALDGRFIPPGPAGAPSSGRTDVLPTGRNLYGIDPRMLPTRSALTLAERAAGDLLRRHRADHGDWPRSVMLNVWGASAMRTGGEDIALALLLIGARPLWDDGSGRVNGFEITPLATLDRPRIDVTLRISGLFRDAFAAQVTLLDEAARAAAARDEAGDWNFLIGQDAARVFGPPPGQYGTGNDWFGASATQYGRSEQADPAALTRRMRATDAFLLVQDHAETDLLDGPEHAAHIGGFAAAAAALGLSPALYHHDGGVRTAAEQVRRVVRGRAANPAWLAGMMRHGYSGAAEIARAVDALHAFAAQLPDRFDRQFDLLHDATLGTPKIDAFLREANPAARAAIQERFSAARTAGLWHPRRNDIAA
jgi:cobaltochelatase CobN